MIGNGNANAVFTKTGSGSDTTMPLLAINYSLKPVAGEDPNYRRSYATLTVDANGGADDSFLKVLVTVYRFDETGTATTNYTYQISGSAAKVAWSTTAPTYTAKALTMKDVVDLLNEIDGVQAFVMHCPHSWSVATDDFIDLAATMIPTQPAKYLETLYRDYSNSEMDTDHEVFFMRVGVPEMRDAGSMKLIGLDVNATGTTPNVRLFRDDVRDFSKEYNATFNTELLNKQMYVNTTVATGTQTAVVSKDLLDAVTIQGPVVLMIDQSDLTTCVASLRLIQASI
jgi:hypothetical protein